MAILTNTLQSLPFFEQMAVYRVMIYPYLTLNTLHISLIIQFIIIKDSKVKKTHQTQIKSFFHSNKLYQSVTE
jgi:hypothetical protein